MITSTLCQQVNQCNPHTNVANTPQSRTILTSNYTIHKLKYPLLPKPISKIISSHFKD